MSKLPVKYLKPRYKQLARIMFESHGISARNPAHVLAYCKANIKDFSIDDDSAKLRYRAGLYVFGLFNAAQNFALLLSCLREYEAKQLGYTSEAMRVYAQAQGKAPKTGETVSVYA